jgi:hypothetical protein
MPVGALGQLHKETFQDSVESDLLLGDLHERFHPRDKTRPSVLFRSPENPLPVSPEPVHQDRLRLIVQVMACCEL